jgi:threonine 3-dehydrogenase
VKKGDDLLVIGCGPIGLFAIQIAKEWGAHPIYAADIDPKRLELAKMVGADVLIDTKSEDLKDRIMRETNHTGVGHLIEASGYPPVVDSCFFIARKGGNVCLVGIPKKPISIQGTGKDFVFRSITVRGIHGRKIWHTWKESEKLMLKINPEVMVTHKIPLTRYEEAFEALFSGQACKILLDPQN